MKGYDLMDIYYTNIMMPQFDWLCNVCGCVCVISPTSGIYWFELGFINNCKES